jgi:phosphoribosyl-ATP pyrophosphohydrolase
MIATDVHSLKTLAELLDRISDRRTSSPDTSYTARLLHEGMPKCAKKFGEEAVELALAAVLGDRSQIRAEAADALYHYLVLLEAGNVPLADVLSELSQRMRQTGLDEKASRKRP